VLSYFGAASFCSTVQKSHDLKEIIMHEMPIAPKKFSVFILFRLFVRHFNKSRISGGIAILTLVALIAFSVASLAVAQQGFALMGTWQHTEKSFFSTVTFNPDGTFQSKYCVGTGASGQGSGCAQWRGIYRATGASSWVAQVQAFQNCASGGGCNSCPRSRGDLPAPGNYGCDIAKSLFGLTIGTQMKQGWQMQGQNQYVDEQGQMWRRVR
jgi:hypothetical protein